MMHFVVLKKLGLAWFVLEGRREGPAVYPGRLKHSIT